MRLVVRHGHYAFYPRDASEIRRYCVLYGAELERVDDFFTFPFLVDLEEYSLPLLPYGNLPALKIYQGKPWEVMKENGFVYSLALKLFVLKSAIAIPIDPPLTGNYFVAQSPIIQAGSRNLSGSQVLSYSAEYNQDYQQLRVTEMSYE